MQLKRRAGGRIGAGAVLMSVIALLGIGTPSAGAVGSPVVAEAWTTAVFSSSARLQGRINPNGAATTYHFDYITKAAYDANGGNFTGASRIPVASDANAGSGTSPVSVVQLLSALKVETTYYYRLEAKNSSSSPAYVENPGPAHLFTTQSAAAGADSCPNKVVREQQHSAYLPDCRAFEMVTPIDKNGGEAGAPGTIASGGVLQAASGGGAITYSSEASFAGGGEGAPPASQYVAGRTSGGWAAQNISAPLVSGGYDSTKVGAPYQLFSGDLARALLLNGAHCRGDATGCAVPNPPLTGSGAPAGYQDYYLRDNGTASFQALLGPANSGFLTLQPKAFDMSLAGTSSDLLHGVISTCARLTADATEVPLGEGCNPADQNLYEYSSGGALSLVNILPAQSTGNPGAKLAAQSAAVSADGSRVYWNDVATGHLYLRAGGQTKLVAEEATFETASSDGSVSFYTKANHLFRYDATVPSSTDLTPGGGVLGVLGASASGDTVYYLDGGGVHRWHNGTTTLVAPAADTSNYPPATGTARVTGDGARLLFVSTPSLTGYDNKDASTEQLDAQVYLYDAAGVGTLTCLSCNPTNARPVGSATLPGSVANGSLTGSIDSYKPRSLSVNGRRAFFESGDALASNDTNQAVDTYQWEAQGEGDCLRAGGCVSLISTGRETGGAHFVDASADGSDAFFLTDESLVPSDPGAVDIYDSRQGGGFVLQVPPIVCEGDACQSLPPEPVDPTLTTLLEGLGNPGISYPNTGKKCKKGKVRRKGKCVPKKHKRHAMGHRGAGR